MVYNLWLLQLCTCSKVSSSELEITLSAGLVEWRAGHGAGGSEEKLEPSSITVYLALPVKCRTTEQKMTTISHLCPQLLHFLRNQLKTEK